MLSITEALSLLTPYDVDRRKERIGPAKDGGYILLPELFSNEAVFSYGISTEYQFDDEMALRGHSVFMFDHTINGIENPRQDPRLLWFKEGVGNTSDPSKALDTIENHINKYAPNSDRLILKMDVEGCEYDAFDCLPLETLNRFQQIVFEIHDLHNLQFEEFRSKFVRVLTKLNRIFTLFHVHANNYDGRNASTFIDGMPMSNLLELSFVKTDLVTRKPSETLYPTSLDYPCVHAHDKKLWFFPFLPTNVKALDFSAADQRIQLVAELKLLKG